MPVLSVPHFRCKHCQDSGLIIVMAAAVKHPHNEGRKVTEDDRRTGLDPALAHRYSPARIHSVEIACTFCPPAPRPVYRRDWAR